MTVPIAHAVLWHIHGYVEQDTLSIALRPYDIEVASVVHYLGAETGTTVSAIAVIEKDPVPFTVFVPYQNWRTLRFVTPPLEREREIEIERAVLSALTTIVEGRILLFDVDNSDVCLGMRLITGNKVVIEVCRTGDTVYSAVLDLLEWHDVQYKISAGNDSRLGIVASFSVAREAHSLFVGRTKDSALIICHLACVRVDYGQFVYALRMLQAAYDTLYQQVNRYEIYDETAQ